jgi:hypothetical protein
MKYQVGDMLASKKYGIVTILEVDNQSDVPEEYKCKVYSKIEDRYSIKYYDKIHLNVWIQYGDYKFYPVKE